MKIGILSDSHNEIENVKKAVSVFESLGIDTVIHCGDVTIPRVLEVLKFFRVFLAYGNMDIDKEMLSITLKKADKQNKAGPFLDFELAGKRILVIHGDDGYGLRMAIKSGEYDYVFTGHTHRVRDEKVGNTRVINPGALGGAFYEPRSIAYLDLETDQLGRYYLQ